MMKNFFSHLLSAILGAFFVLVLMILFDRIATFYPIYIPNIFFKEPINYSVNVHSQVSEAINKTLKNVVSVNNYQQGNLTGTGSGVIYKLTENTAFIVTNYHVVSGADNVEIETVNGYRVPGKVIGSDAVTDLAVITIPKNTINHYMEFSDSHALTIGEYVIAIGNPLGLMSSATLGIISSKERLVPVDTNNDNIDDWYASVLQTDAPINPGNSGGALINLDGKLVGINSMKIAEHDVEGIGFSIPSVLVSRIIAELETNGVVFRPIRLLGITIQGVSYEGDYALEIIKVEPNTLASRLNLKVNDIITKINGQGIMNLYDLKYYLSTTPVDKVIVLDIIRDGNKVKTEIIIDE